jgi:hypothetical protein
MTIFLVVRQEKWSKKKRTPAMAPESSGTVIFAKVAGPAT